jgi:hypothetical protein
MALFLLASLLLSPLAGAAVHRVRMEGQGVYLAGVAFFSAFPTPEGSDTMLVNFGDLETLSWVPGAMPVVDAHVMAVNSTGRPLPEIKVKVSLYLGVASLSALPAEHEIFPGAEGLRESLFFERVFTVKKFLHATIRRVTVSDIHLSEAIEDKLRQGLWPGYLRVEAQVVEKPEAVPAPLDMTTGFLKIVPRDAKEKPAPAKQPAQPGI